jgi:hypothetical protein
VQPAPGRRRLNAPGPLQADPIRSPERPTGRSQAGAGLSTYSDIRIIVPVLFLKIFQPKWNQIPAYRTATVQPDFRLKKFPMEPNNLNKSLPSEKTDDSEVLHFGDGISA